jgi:hypothetical protein
MKSTKTDLKNMESLINKKNEQNLKHLNVIKAKAIKEQTPES